MANNRMYLRCKICKTNTEKINDWAEPVIFLAKYYPAQAWYWNGENVEYAARLEQYFENHVHYENNGAYFELLYEDSAQPSEQL